MLDTLHQLQGTHSIRLAAHTTQKICCWAVYSGSAKAKTVMARVHELGRTCSLCASTMIAEVYVCTFGCTPAHSRFRFKIRLNKNLDLNPSSIPPPFCSEVTAIYCGPSARSPSLRVMQSLKAHRSGSSGAAPRQPSRERNSRGAQGRHKAKLVACAPSASIWLSSASAACQRPPHAWQAAMSEE